MRDSGTMILHNYLAGWGCAKYIIGNRDENENESLVYRILKSEPSGDICFGTELRFLLF